MAAIARCVTAAAARPADLVARHGEAGLALLLPETTTGRAAGIARNLVETVAALSFPDTVPLAGTPSGLSLSVGLATAALDAATLQAGRPDAAEHVELMRAADDALFSAKHAGGNQAWWLDVDDAAPPCPLD